MEFRKYSSIENTYRTKELNDIREQGLDGGRWVVQEKVHGANYSFWTDGTEVKVAKRTAWADGSFYNSHSVIEKYSQSVINLFNFMKEVNENIEYVQIFGELFGGHYPGVKSQVKAIQKGVAYFNEVDFYAFDIRVSTSTGKNEYLNVDDANRLFEQFEFFFAKHIFSGSFTECLEYTNEYNSTIPAMKGMPEMDEPNICEGNVIRPIVTTRNRAGNRVLLKNKNEKWSEKSNKSRTPKIPIEVPEHIQKYVSDLDAYVTENRLRNVISKYGTVGQKEFGKLAGLLVKDAIEEFMKDHTEFELLDKNERKMVTKQAGKMGAELIRPNFLDILDGEY